MKESKSSVCNLKTVFISVCVLLMSLNSVVVAEHQEISNQIILSYSFDQPTIKQIQIENTLYDEIILSDVFITGNPGEPCLPIKGSFILLPQGSSVDTITVTPREKTLVDDTVYIKPVGDIVPLSQRTCISVPTPDEAIYGSDAEFPGSLFSNVGIYRFRGYSILVLDLYPVQYAPASGDLFYYD